MTAFRPIHPGQIVRREVLFRWGSAKLGTLAELAGLHVEELADLLESRIPVTLERAQGLERLLEISTDSWLTLQANFDAWQEDAREN